MRRNFIPINNNRFQPVSSQSSVISHLNKMSALMGRPTHAQTNNSQPSVRVSSNMNININVNNSDDSDQDYLDDYILDES